MNTHWLILAALADIATTWHWFKLGGGESNKLVTRLFGARPSLGEMLAVKVVAVAIVLFAGIPWLTLGGAVFWAACAAWNLRLIVRRR